MIYVTMMTHLSSGNWRGVLARGTYRQEGRRADWRIMALLMT